MNKSEKDARSYSVVDTPNQRLAYLISNIYVAQYLCMYDLDRNKDPDRGNRAADPDPFFFRKKDPMKFESNLAPDEFI